MRRSPLVCSSLAWLACLLASAVETMAQERGDDLVDARNIGRAGASVVSNDSGVAVVQNPAGMVRRGGSRILLGLGVRGSDVEFTSTNSASPSIESSAPPSALPTLAYHHAGSDDTWVLGVLLWSGRQESALPTPAFGQPADDIGTLFPHRYGGTGFRESWRQLAAGAALRVGESLGLGASLAIRDVEVRDERRIWAGFAGRDRLLGAERDLALTFSGRDYVTPSATAGLLYAPIELPLEFAASVETRLGVSIEAASATLRPTSPASFPQVPQERGSANLDRPHSSTLRAGLRYLGDRLFVETSVDMVLVHGQPESVWRASGLEVVDESTVAATIFEVRALQSERSHATARGAVDYEALSGFLWLTAGYAWHAPATGQNSRMPAYARLGGHRIAVGLLAAHEDYTLTLGYSRRLERRADVNEDQGSVPALNPFNAGTGSSNAGAYRSSSDQLGFSVEVGW